MGIPRCLARASQSLKSDEELTENMIQLISKFSSPGLSLSWKNEEEKGLGKQINKNGVVPMPI